MVIQDVSAVYPSLTLRAPFDRCARINSNWYKDLLPLPSQSLRFKG
jgi:hypothetical protein